MTKEELMALLRDPDQTGQSVDELNRLIEENPYFHTGHQLHLQAIKKTDESQMALQLTKTALNVRNRGLLYNYINRPSAFRQQTTAPEDDEMMPFAPGNAFVSPDADKHNIQRIQNELSVPLQGALGMEGLRKESEPHVVVEEQIVTGSTLLDYVQQADPARHQPETGEETATTDNVAGEVPVTGDISPARESEDVEIREAYSSDQLASDLAAVEPRQTGLVTIPPRDIVVPGDIEEDVTVMGEEKEVTNIDLIDSFLKANPKIIPSEREYTVDLTESLQEDQDIATETLADIYLSQGHIKKAIEIYEHLILKYPEKHIYFAAQIDRLKQELI